MKYIALLSLSLIFFAACEPSNQQNQEQQLAFTSTPTSSNSNINRISPQRKATGLIGNSVVKIDYSAPNVNDRIIWGGLVPYGEVWRTGANEATVISLEKDILIQGERLESGKYSIYTIPARGGEWTIIFNYIWDQWGTEYNESHDALRVITKPKKITEKQEQLKISVEGEELVIRWDRIHIPLTMEALPEEEV